MKKKILLIGMVLFGLSLFTGCFKRDNLEDVQITTTSYPLQYITERLYGEYSTIESIYPLGVNIQNYELTSKQIKDFSNSSIFIFNGLSKEKDYVIPMFDYNKNIKIIDTSMSMEYSNEIEELWLDPSNFLMLAQNIKNGLQEYIDDVYLKNQIEEKYEELKVDVSNIDASIKLAVESGSNKTIVVANDLFKFLEKYGYTVISLEENSNFKNIEKISEEGLPIFRQKYLGFVFQSYNLLPTLTALENVTLPLVFMGINKKSREKRAKEMLKAVGLEKRLKHKPSEMSGGQQQRVSIARAFVNNPEIIFADEPTGNLDTKTTYEMMNLITSKAKEHNQTLIIVTHDLEIAEYADEIVYLKDGHIIKTETNENPKTEVIYNPN